MRDGRSFTTRHVVARQQGREIFEMAASFQTGDHGHRAPARDARRARAARRLHSELADAAGRWRDRLPERWRVKGLEPHGIEFRAVEPRDLLRRRCARRTASIWMRAVAPLPDDPVVHRALLAYASDHGLLRAALRRTA